MFFPLEVGNYWIYYDTEGNDNNTLKIDATEEINGELWYHFTFSLFSTDGYFIERESGLFIKQFGKENIGLKYPMEIGQNWQFLDPDNNVSVSYLVQSLSSLQIEGNFYEDCFKIQGIINSPYNTDTSYQWYKKGVGFVKDEYSYLIDYKLY